MSTEMIFWLVLSAALSYLVAGVNFAVIFSNLIYKKDIRQLGSKNPGFTNFKRVFGGPIAWIVLLLDLLKVIVPVLAFGIIFDSLFKLGQTGAAFAGLFAMLGHAFPVWYRFKGGKSFIAGVATIWTVDWRVGLIATIIFLVMLFTIRYMSLASITVSILYPVIILFFSPQTMWVVLFLTLGAALITWRHKENIVRLISKTEKKFYFKKKAENT